ncbi:protein trichome birefringence-like 21 [Rutidosis leptorrhynchoides]|uniref:protein trichome birefringence-like 21 n=1 Tax=Rutidosis leptorrhynchoides TaxID=125765 RepID=UPI003A9A19A3
MKSNPIELPTTTTNVNNNNIHKPLINSKQFILPSITLALLITIHLNIVNFSDLRLVNPVTTQANSTDEDNKCNLFQGSWVFDDEREMYYTNETKCIIDDRQNCMKYGRPDNDFMRWRWQPNKCDLPEFDAVEFLEIVRGKSMGFIGDSLGRNQMQSLVCMLANEAYPIDVSNTSDTRYRRWLFPTYNFTLVAIWSPLLVKTRDPNPNNFTSNSLMNIYLDEADDRWTSQVQTLDIIVFSAGQWFYRPFMYYEQGQLVGCRLCIQENVTDLGVYYAYQKASRTAFSTLLNVQNYTGLVFLRSLSPQHFENGGYYDGGNCVRTRPFETQEMKLDGYQLQMYLTQVNEFKAVQKEGENRGLKFRLLDSSDAMILRPDGHPNHYGHPASDNKSFADCVHWCMPGPVDTWNEFLLEMLKMEGDGFIEKSAQRNITKLN